MVCPHGLTLFQDVQLGHPGSVCALFTQGGGEELRPGRAVNSQMKSPAPHPLAPWVPVGEPHSLQGSGHLGRPGEASMSAPSLARPQP